MKRFRRVAVILFAILVVVGILASLFLGNIVKTAVNKVGPSVLHVPVSLEKAHFGMIRGRFWLKGFVLGNPEGFETPHAIKLDSLMINVKLSSLFTDKILVQEVRITKPDINYEQSMHGSNLAKIQELIGGEKKPGDEQKEEDKPKSKKRVIIDTLRVEDGSIHLSLPGMGAGSIPLALPNIELHDIGKEKDGASIGEIVKEVINAIIGSVSDVVSGSGKLIGEGAEAIGDAATEGAKAVGSALNDAAGAIGDLFKK